MKIRKIGVLLILTGIFLCRAVPDGQTPVYAANVQEATEEKNYKIVLLDEEVPLSSGKDEMSKGMAFAFYSCMTAICLGAVFLYEKRLEKEKKSRQIEKEAAKYLRKDLITENDN